MMLKLWVGGWVGVLFQLLKHFEQKLQSALNAFRTKMLPPLRRGATLDVYLTSSGLYTIIPYFLFDLFFPFYFAHI